MVPPGGFWAGVLNPGSVVKGIQRQGSESQFCNFMFRIESPSRRGQHLFPPLRTMERMPGAV